MRPMHSRRVERRPPRVSHHLFFALQPPDEVRERIEAAANRLKDDQAPAGRWIKPHRYHLTLCYLGQHAILPDELVVAAHAAADRVRVPGFAFALDRAGSFANRDVPWWLGCREIAVELAALWDGISAGLHAHGLRAGDADRVPHVTLLRDADRLLPAMPITPIAWPVEEFVLVDSVLGPDARHLVLRRWRLPG